MSSSPHKRSNSRRKSSPLSPHSNSNSNPNSNSSPRSVTSSLHPPTSPSPRSPSSTPLPPSPLSSVSSIPFPQPQARPRGRTTSAVHAPAGGSLGSPLSRVVSEGRIAATSASSESPGSAFTSFWWGKDQEFVDGKGKRKDDGKERQKEKEKRRQSRNATGDKGKDIDLEKEDPAEREDVEELEKDKGPGWVITRERVSQATHSVLGSSLDVAHELLLTTVDILEYVPLPVPGLAQAAKVLLGIWGAVQSVQTNRTQCLRLTERCAEILLSVREEVREAGDEVGEELSGPVGKLVESFEAVRTLIQSQLNRPFLKRYLKRDEIQAQIQACDRGLGEALSMFSLGIQIRILRVVQEGERRRKMQEAEWLALGGPELVGKRYHDDGVGNDEVVGLGLELDRTPTGSVEGERTPRMDLSASAATVKPLPSPQTTPLNPSAILLTPTPSRTNRTLSPSPDRTSTSIPTSPSHLPPSQILPTLLTLHTSQNTHDAARDAEELRALMRAALRAGSDVDMLEVLQIGREEMPEAIKALQRALERVGEPVEGAVTTKAEVQKQQGKPSEEPKETKQEKRTSRWGIGRGIGFNPVKRIGLDGRRKSVDSAAPRRTSGDSAQVPGIALVTPATTPLPTSISPDPTLDREFIESGIDALRRMSRNTPSLPSWTITRYEVDIDRSQKIGVGFFSDVYLGRWRGRTVAVKVLAARGTTRRMFEREVGVWRGLNHPNVLELFGAGGGGGDDERGEGGPWFFVCRYMRRGSLVEFLKRVERGLEGGEGTAPQQPRATFPIWGPQSPSPKSRSPSRTPGKGDVVPREGDLFRFMLEIAQGMEYLHANGVLHGDLKAANVLVDDDVHCVISDFGQSEMKSEAYRISGGSPPRGTLRWQAPELMSGQIQLALTPQMDVYAFAISCVEIIGMGKLPWALADDDAVRHFVLKENSRPSLPQTRFNTQLLQDLLRACWNQDPKLRPSFENIVKSVKVMRKAFLADVGHHSQEPSVPVSSPIMIEHNRRDWESDGDWYGHSKPSPDMRPVPLPMWGTGGGSYTPPIDSALKQHNLEGSTSPDSSATESTFVTANEDHSTSSSAGTHSYSHQHSHREDIVDSGGRIRIPEPQPALYTPSAPSNPSSPTTSSRASSLFTHTPSSRSLDDLGLSLTTPGDVQMMMGYESPAPIDERIKMMRDERRYRLLLGHVFHPSLTLPLWDPSPVKLGTVGYLLKPEGRFITLFNSFAPDKSRVGAVKSLPSLYGYGRLKTGSQRQDRRNAAQRGYDAFVGLLTFKSRGGGVSSQSVSRRYSFPLRAGHKTAHLCTESTMYRYVESLDVPKKWFKANVDAIMQIYGPTHHIQKEDLFLVIGTLDAQEYALFVSHNHPDGQAHFNVFSSPRNGQPWGTFTTDTEVPHELGGPSYDEPVVHALSSSKVSNNGKNWDTVLLARLRFKPDVLEPTSL